MAIHFQKENSEKQKVSLMLLIVVVAFSLLAISLTASRNSSGTLFGVNFKTINNILNKEKVKGVSTPSTGDGNVCDVLGLETGDVKSYISQYSNYYNQNLGVLDTDICPGNSITEIVGEITNSRASNIHTVRLGMSTDNCVFDSDGDFNNIDDPANVSQTVKMIDSIRSQTKGMSAPEVHIMPVIEPRSDWSRKFGDDCNGDNPTCQAAINEGHYLKNIVNGLKATSSADTQNYLIFPALNFHTPNLFNTKLYMDKFINAYGVEDFRKDFVSYGISLQRDPNGPPDAQRTLTERISEYRNLLDSNYGLSDYKLSFFSANVVNATADDAFVQDLLTAGKDHIDVLDGIYITTPWGWQGSESQSRNFEIPINIWNQIFSECGGTGTVNCKLSPVSDLPGIKSCNTPKDSSALGSMKLQPVEKDYVIQPIVTQKATMSLVGWLGDTNYLQKTVDPDFTGPSYGTNANPIIAPCARDSKIDKTDQYDLTKQFSGPIRFYRSSDKSDYIDYQMPLLGNAVACMVWSEMNTWDGEGMGTLEPRFALKNGETLNQSRQGFSGSSLDVLSTSAQTMASWIARLAGQISSAQAQCSGEITRLDTTDVYNGPEMIIYDQVQTIDGTTIQKGIKTGDITKGPDGYYHYAFKWDKITSAEIPGIGKGMAQGWIDEAVQNPWSSSYKVIHKDKVGVKVTLEQKIYDGLSNSNSGYTGLLSTDSQCKYQKFESTAGKSLATIQTRTLLPSPIGKTEFYFPWIGQTLKMNTRTTRIFTNQKEIAAQTITSNDGKTQSTVNYIDAMHAKISKIMETKASKHDLDFYSSVARELLNPNYLYRCSDMDLLKDYINEGKKLTKNSTTQKQADVLIHIITTTDCLGKTNDFDPMQDWLCSEKLLPSVFCQNQCKSLKSLNTGVGVACPVKGSFTCLQGVGGNYSHLTPASMSAKDLVTYERVALDLQPKEDGNAYAPEAVKVTSPAVEYKSETLTGTCGLRMVLESINNPGLYYSIYHLSLDASKNNPSIYVQGEVLAQGDLLGALIPKQPGEKACVNGMHLHISINTNFTKAVDPYAYFEDSCGVITCDNENKSILNDTSKVSQPSSLDLDYDNLINKDAQCTTANGEAGYVSDRILSTPNEGVTPEYLYESLSEKQQRVLNACPVVLPQCDEHCKEMVKAWIRRLAEKNINYLGRRYNETNYYSVNEVMTHVDKMYTEAHDDISFQLLIAIWLSEDGFNPVYKNPGFKSDVFGCGVFCSPTPQNFDEELACVTRELRGCSMNYTFDTQKPGAYLEKYGPIESNATFATKVFMTFGKLAEIQGVSNYRPKNPASCNLYVYDEIPSDLDWAVDLLAST